MLQLVTVPPLIVALTPLKDSFLGSSQSQTSLPYVELRSPVQILAD